MKQKFAYTLAELMVTITVIGVITALTVPTLINNYQKKSQVSLLKKAYVNLGDNLSNYKSEQGINSIPSMDKKRIKAFIEKNYDKARKCEKTTSCFSSKYRTISGGSVNFSANGGYGAVSKDGVAIYISPETIPAGQKYSRVCLGSKPSDCYMNYDAFSNNKIATVYVDVNSKDYPNIGGRDMFTFNIYGDYSIDVVSPSTIRAGTAASSRTTLFNDNCLTSSIGKGCLGKILNDNWEMNY